MPSHCGNKTAIHMHSLQPSQNAAAAVSRSHCSRHSLTPGTCDRVPLLQGSCDSHQERARRWRGDARSSARPTIHAASASLSLPELATPSEPAPSLEPAATKRAARAASAALFCRAAAPAPPSLLPRLLRPRTRARLARSALACARLPPSGLRRAAAAFAERRGERSADARRACACRITRLPVLLLPLLLF